MSDEAVRIVVSKERVSMLDQAPQIPFSILKRGDLVIVQTASDNRYELAVKEDFHPGRALKVIAMTSQPLDDCKQGWAFYVMGSSWGGSMLYIGGIVEGMCMVLSTKGVSGRELEFSTTPIASVEVRYFSPRAVKILSGAEIK